MKTGLFLEGGGMRGVYTAGVLDYWMERELYFPYLLTVSSGTWHATSYMSRQLGRSRRCSIHYARDPRAASYRNWMLKGSVFGMDFLFDTVPNQLEPFDYEAFFQSEQKLAAVLTDADSGEAIYYTNEDAADPHELKRLLTASISLPYIAKPVEWKGRTLFDGGVADPLPLSRAEEDGYGQCVLVLNKEKGYRKGRSKWDLPAPWVYRRYPNFVEAIMNRYIRYNAEMERLERLEEEGKLFVIRPSTPMQVGRMGRDVAKLQAMYELGYTDAKMLFERMKAWMI